MPSNLPPVPVRAQMFGVDGMLTPPWSDWFIKVFKRVGGNVAFTNDELGNVSTEMIQNSAVTADKIASSVAGNGLTGGDGAALAVNPDGSTLEISSDQIRIKDLGVSTGKIAAEAVSFAKMLGTDWTKSAGASGYTKLPNGIYIQWGVTASTSSGSTASVTFPVAFPTGCLQVLAGIRDNSAVATTTTGQVGCGNFSTTGCSIYNRTSVAQVMNWFAVGY